MASVKVQNGVVRTTCSYCSVGCAIDVQVETGKAAKMLPAADYPVNLGHTCSKGFNLLAPMRTQDRALYPMSRKPDGRWMRITWDEAARVFAERMRAVQDRHGMDAVAVLSTGQIPCEEMAFIGCFARFGMGVRHIDGNTRQCMATSVVAYQQAFGFDAPPYCYEDAEESDCLIFVGANPVIAHPIFWNRVKMNRHRPAIVVLDPRRTETAAEATHHLALKPKSDLTVLYAVAHWLIRSGCVKNDWVDAHTSGFEGFARHVAAFPLERAAAQSGLPIDQIEELARLITTRERVSFWWTMGVNQSHQGVRTAQAIINLCLITGHIGRPGTGPKSLTGQANAMGSRLFSNSTTLLGGRDFAQPEHRARIAEILALPEEGIPTDPGKTYTQIIKGIGKGEIKALWVICTNPAHSWIAKGHLLKHRGKLEFLVVQDLYTTTQTAKLADLVLPAAGSPEKEGTFINSERRLGIVQKVMDPPGEALSDFEIVKKLVQAWGCAERFSAWKDVDAAFEIIREATKGQPCDIGGIKSRRQLLESGGIQWPFLSSPEVGTASDRSRRLFADGRFFHPDGRAKFLTGRVERVPEIPDGEWPFWLLTGRGTVHQWHTGTRTDKVELLTGRYPMEAYAELNSEDALQLGVTPGNRVRISNRRGSVEVDVRIAESTPAGAIFLPMHYEETNFLTYPAFDSFSDQPAYKMGAVKVEKS
ncbi:MAG: molybdopterin oxidoreductase family protein [Chromatiales bacterium]